MVDMFESPQTVPVRQFTILCHCLPMVVVCQEARTFIRGRFAVRSGRAAAGTHYRTANRAFNGPWVYRWERASTHWASTSARGERAAAEKGKSGESFSRSLRMVP